MTYEDAGEVEVLQSLWRPGAPLENTVFAILDPQGHPLTRGSRSPDWLFRNESDMATSLTYLANRYQSSAAHSNLPVVSTVRLGMNVAACDKLPLAIVLSDHVQERRQMEAAMAPLAWSNNYIGKLTYTAGSLSELRSIQGVRLSRGYVFVSPNLFGTSGSVVAQLGPNATAAQLQAAMKITIDRHNPQVLDHREHIRLGHESNISWQSATPVTDPHQPPGGAPGGMGRPQPHQQYQSVRVPQMQVRNYTH